MPENNTGIRKIFTGNEQKKLTEPEVNYYGSLTPSWELLRHTRKINFLIGFNNDPLSIPLVHQNNINNHIFKPQYFTTSSPGVLDCYCASEDIYNHTLRGLYMSMNHLDCPEIEMSVNHIHEGNFYSDLSSWTIHNSILFCRPESFLEFVLIEWLSEKGVDLEKIESVVTSVEMNRLVTKWTSDHLINHSRKELEDIGLDVTEFLTHYKIEHQKSANPYLKSVNLKYRDKDVTLIQLTWGISLSRELLQNILNLNPHIEKVGIVGGVGYVGQDNVELDDIFVPKNLGVLSDGSLALHDLHNKVLETKENKIFADKKVTSGTVVTVIPERGKTSYTEKFNSVEQMVDAHEMELEGFLEILKQHPNIVVGMVYYIMDIPKRNLYLGSSYYNISYLNKLFSTFNRGKLYCMEKIANFLA